MPEERKAPGSTSVGKWLIAGILLSFLIGAALFLTVAQTRSGEPIPPDAAPHYYMHDAG